MKQLDLEALLERVMNEEQLSVVFQPILSLDKQSIYAYEGLVRGPENSPLHSPGDLFDAAAHRQCLSRLDLLCCKTIIRRFAELRLPGCLFLNVDPRSFSETSFTPERILSYLQDNYIDPRRVVIEITETHRFKDLSLLEMALRRYRNIGLKLALDDLGSGYSGLTLWYEINPEFVKIDRHFIQNVHEDKVKRLFIKSVLSIAGSLECEVIAEGIENKSEYIALRKLGLKLAQGYYFEKPNATPNITPDLELFSQRPIRATMAVRPTAACLLRPSIFVTSDTRIENVGELFQTHLEIRSIPVVDKGEPLGLVLRTELMNLLASRFGRDLYGRKPVKTFINSRPIKLDMDMFLEDASKHITNSVNEYTDRFGMSRSFPIMTLSVGVVSIESPHENLSLEQIQELTSAAKSKAKKLTGDSIYVETYIDLPPQVQLFANSLNPHTPGFCPGFLPDTTSSRPFGEARLS